MNSITDLRLKRAQSLVGMSDGRPDLDFYPTPPAATKALLAAEQFEGRIWEPACGSGAMSDVLVEHGYDVLSTDIHDYGYAGMSAKLDFLKAGSDTIVDNVVTNPPFTLGQKFVEKALSVSTRKVAILQKLAFLESIERMKLFQSTPLRRVWVFGPRLTLSREGQSQKNSGMIAFAWFVWDHSHDGEATLGWLDHRPFQTA